jgi:predicted nucleic acid-binding protein
VIFWDTSAIVPLVAQEPESHRLGELARGDPVLIVWWGSAVECASAIARREREGVLSASSADAARKALAILRAAWDEVLPTEEVRDHAGRLLLRHPLRAADALQLGAAMTWTRGRPRDHAFACLDDRLSAAAKAEGFRLVVR